MSSNNGLFIKWNNIFSCKKTISITVLIHEIDLQSRPVIITIFAHGVCTFVCLPVIFQNLAKQIKFQLRIVIATGGNVGLATWSGQRYH